MTDFEVLLAMRVAVATAELKAGMLREHMSVGSRLDSSENREALAKLRELLAQACEMSSRIKLRKDS